MLNSGKKIALCATKKINILTLAFRYKLLCFSACQYFIQTCLIFCFIMSCCMYMPVATQRGSATWSPAGIYMQYARYGKNSFRFADSRLKIASLNSRVFCSPGMGPNVTVLHVDD